MSQSPRLTLFAFLIALANPVYAQGEDPVVRHVMSTYGLSEADARAQLRLLDEANTLGNRLQSDEPTRYAGLRIVRGSNTQVFVRLVGAADQLLAKYTTNPAFIAEKADVPLVALRNKQNALVRALLAKSDFAISVDVPTGRIIVSVPDVEKATGAIRASGLLGGNVVIEHVPTTYAAAATIVGGYQILGKNWDRTDGLGQVRATASLGFNVKNSSNVRGVLTAGHFDECSFTVAVNGCVKNSIATDAKSGATLTYQGQQLGNDLDYEWRTSSGNTFSNTIFYGTSYASGSTQPVTSVVDPRAYQPGTLTVCKMGARTFYTCGTLMDPNFAVYNSTFGINGAYCRVQNNSAGLMADEGDSGGPVFGGGITAYGIVEGRISGGTYIDQMVFMPIQKISGLGLSVLTTP